MIIFANKEEVIKICLECRRHDTCDGCVFAAFDGVEKCLGYKSNWMEFGENITVEGEHMFMFKIN